MSSCLDLLSVASTLTRCKESRDRLRLRGTLPTPPTIRRAVARTIRRATWPPVTPVTRPEKEPLDRPAVTLTHLVELPALLGRQNLFDCFPGLCHHRLDLRPHALSELRPLATAGPQDLPDLSLLRCA